MANRVNNNYTERTCIQAELTEPHSEYPLTFLWKNLLKFSIGSHTYLDFFDFFLFSQTPWTPCWYATYDISWETQELVYCDHTLFLFLLLLLKLWIYFTIMLIIMSSKSMSLSHTWYFFLDRNKHNKGGTGQIASAGSGPRIGRAIVSQRHVTNLWVT